MTRPRGGYIGFNRVPAASGLNSAASGVWTPREAESLKRAGTWPSAFSNISSLPNLQLHLDASDSSTLFDSVSGGNAVALDGGVARWEDKSGNGRHFTQATAANRPARKSNQIGGLDALLYDGSNDVLTRANDAWGFLYPITAFVVFRATAFSSSYNSLWDFYTHGSNASFAGHTGLIKSNGKSAVYLTAGATASYDGTGAITYNTSTSYLFTCIIEQDNIETYANGTADFGPAGAFTPATSRSTLSFEIGASVTFSRYTQISIGEVVFLGTTKLSSASRNLVESYLKTKWGIT